MFAKTSSYHSVLNTCVSNSCPEPVLVKCSFLYINGSKRPFFSTFADGEVKLGPSVVVEDKRRVRQIDAPFLARKHHSVLLHIRLREQRRNLQQVPAETFECVFSSFAMNICSSRAWQICWFFSIKLNSKCIAKTIFFAPHERVWLR